MERNSTSVWVVAVALIDSGNRVLMQQRRMNTMYGGLWEFPGGKVMPGEAPADAARREIGEELALDMAADGLVPISFAAEPRAPQTPALTILLYGCRAWHGDPVPHAADAIGWFTAAHVQKLAMPPLDIPLAHRLEGLLVAGML